MKTLKCIICGKSIGEEEEYIECCDCNSRMHKGCFDGELLTDANGNPLCPICASTEALDWLDELIASYTTVYKRDPRGENIKSRLQNLLKILEGKA